ncbi:MAG: AI-2E family transporter [Hyphomonas sp.]
MTGHSNLSDFTARLLVTILLVGLALVLWAARDAVLLGFAAILLAIAVHGIADGLMRIMPLPRPAALAIAALSLLGSVAAIFWLFGAQLAGELSRIVDRLPEAWGRVREILESNSLGASLVFEIENALSGNSEGSLQGMLANVGGYALPLASGLTTALLVMFIAAFMTTSARSIRRGTLLLLPKGIDVRVGDALDASGRALKKWLLGITIDMVIIAVAMAIALWALGVPAFIGLALIAGLSQFVPTIGPLVSSIPGILLAFTVGPMTALWTAIAYLAVSQLESAFVYPLVQQKTASIPPVLILISVLAFGMLLGPLGILLATPMLVVFSVFIVKLYVQDTLKKEAGYPGQ